MVSEIKNKNAVFVIFISFVLVLIFSEFAFAASYYAEQVTCQDVNSGMNQKSYEGYALGFISGVNFSIKRDSDVVADGRQIYPWVQNYCLKNPSDRLIDAVVALDREIDRVAAQ